MSEKIAGLILISAVLCSLASGCRQGGESILGANAQSSAEDGALILLEEFARPDADGAAMSRRLRPDRADYEAIFEPEFAEKIAAAYQPAWSAGQFVLAPGPEQTQVRIYSATSDEMKNWSGNAREFSEGWKSVAPMLHPNIKIYRVKFVEPGREFGTVYEGLIYVNGNWRLFPKPWRAMD